MDNILALTETEFFRKLRKGLPTEDLHVELRDFIIRVHEVTHPASPLRFYASWRMRRHFSVLSHDL